MNPKKITYEFDLEQVKTMVCKSLNVPFDKTQVKFKTVRQTDPVDFRESWTEVVGIEVIVE